ncbi:putative microtubule-associated protein [Paratrimastix pyriformis]|uniref:Microtubule-associated protein n=1 Tax=Paratrimastix pyriformis TaxID=342808 RepID=A0ABQ8USV7_9EUKA|nr:putative microtubule-associated protein [Paratrimastix pyriformis]
MLAVEVLRAVDLVNVDTDGTVSDPFATVTFGAKTENTLVVEDSLCPEWNETFYFPIALPPSGEIQVAVVDDSRHSLGQAVVPISALQIGARTEIECPLQGVRSGRITLGLRVLEKLTEEAEVVERDVAEEGEAEEEEEEICCAAEDEAQLEFNPMARARGAVHVPAKYADMSFPKDAPTEELVLQQVYGYRGADCHHNAFALPDGSVAYHIAAVGIVMDPRTRQQRFFRAHTDDILCLAANPAGTMIATGQSGKNPPIMLWDPATCQLVRTLAEGDVKGVNVVAFSDDGSRLVSVGIDDAHTVSLWDVATGRKLATTTGGRNKIIDGHFMPGSNTDFVLAGVKCLTFFAFASGALTATRGLFGTTVAPDTLSGVQPMAGGQLVTPSASGALLVWRGRTLAASKPAHQGRAEAICATPTGILTGGADGHIMGFTGSALKKAADCWVGSPVRSLHVLGSRLLVGTQGNALLELVYNPATGAIESGPGMAPATSLPAPPVAAPRPGGIPARAPAAPPMAVTRPNPVVLTQTHNGGLPPAPPPCRCPVLPPVLPPVLTFSSNNAGCVCLGGSAEVWGLAVHPRDPTLCFTCGDDRTVRLWNTEARRMVSKSEVAGPARAVAISPDAALLAVGTTDGHLELLETATMHSVRVVRAAQGKEVSVVRFSPAGDRVAVGTQAQTIEIFAVPSLQLVATCKGHSARIIALDWSADGAVLQSNCNAYELLFWNAATGRQITASSSLKDTEWATYTLKIGWPVLGIWPDRFIPCDGSDINALDANPARTLLCFGDDFHQVELARYPCPDKAMPKKAYPGHSEHVTNTRWTCDGAHVLSTGGLDAALMHWALQ